MATYVIEIGVFEDESDTLSYTRHATVEANTQSEAEAKSSQTLQIGHPFLYEKVISITKEE